jgi:signal transduction histidine kinase/CheY-like chemotaxis protein
VRIKLPGGARFAILSFLCVMGLALTMGFALSTLLTRAVTQWEWENTAALARREVARNGLEALFVSPTGAQTRSRWDRQAAGLLTDLPEVRRIKVWDRNATVIWSDEPRLIGQRFPDNRDLQRALAGSVSVEIKNLKGREHAYERGRFATLAEVYVPIFATESGEVIGVVEVYKLPARLFSTIQQGRTMIWTISLTGAFVLYLVLVPLVRQVYGRRVREETLRAYAAQLENQVAERTKELEVQREGLHQAEKVAAMGQLLAGVAHELNNPLAAILGYAQLLRMRVTSGALAEQLGTIEQAAMRCARIVKNFLSLARHYPPERQSVSLTGIIENSVEVLSYTLRIDDVEVVLSLSDGPALWADPHQLEQVVMNLLTNAHQAVRHGPRPRRITVTTRYDHAADRITLQVADTGNGVPSELRRRIFEPFFTTKPPGQGTGLGLSLCRGIIEGHGGVIRVEDTAGPGAVFVVELPIGVPVSRQAEARVAKAGTAVPTRSILVVDDDPDSAHLLVDLLREDGHHVDLATTGRSALARVRATSFDIIVSDVRMPELDGPGLYHQLALSRPGLEQRVLFVTGDAINPATRDFLEATGVPSLQKPFTVDELRRAIEQLYWTAFGSARRAPSLGRP